MTDKEKLARGLLQEACDVFNKVSELTKGEKAHADTTLDVIRAYANTAGDRIAKGLDKLDSEE